MSSTYVSEDVNHKKLQRENDELPFSKPHFKYKQPKCFAVRTFPDAFKLFAKHVYHAVEEEDPLIESDSEIDKSKDLEIPLEPVDSLINFDVSVIKETFDEPKNEKALIKLEEDESFRFRVNDTGEESEFVDDEWGCPRFDNSDGLKSSAGVEKPSWAEIGSSNFEKETRSSRKITFPPKRKIWCVRSFPPYCGIDATVQMEDVKAPTTPNQEIVLFEGMGQVRRANGLKGKEKIQTASALVDYGEEAVRERKQFSTTSKPKDAKRTSCNELKKTKMEDRTNQSSQNLSKLPVVLGLVAAANCPWKKSRLRKERSSSDCERADYKSRTIFR